jgi:hypothetical protein
MTGVRDERAAPHFSYLVRYADRRRQPNLALAAIDALGALGGASDSVQVLEHLIRRFVQLLGIYPPGTLVRLADGAVAVVTAVHAPDPYRPRVRILVDPAGARLPAPADRSLWESGAHDGPPDRIVEPVDPAAYGVDPLTFLPTRASGDE